MDNLALNEQQQRDLEAWRAEALTQMPYMATVLFALRPVNKPGLGTFAVDDKMRLYIDFDATAEWSDTIKAQALLHECSHILQDHATQFSDMELTDADARTWNVAADAAINDDLRDAGCAELVDMGVLPESIGADDYLTPGEYFTHLKSVMPPTPPAGGSDGGDSEGSPGSGDGEGEPFAGCGDGAGGPQVPNGLGDDDLDGQAAPATSSETHRVRAATAQAISEASAKGRGNVPGGLTTWADGIFTPSKTPWQKVLGRRLRGAVRTVAGQQDTSFQRRNARRHNERLLGSGKRIVHPGTVNYVPSLVVVRDTSGSMNDGDLLAVTREVDAIAKRLRIRGDDLTILDVDTEVSATRQYKGAKSLREVAGRGGTDMVAGIEYALAMKPRPTAIVVITDGGTGWPATKLSRNVPVVACIVGDEYQMGNVPKWIPSVFVESETGGRAR